MDDLAEPSRDSQEAVSVEIHILVHVTLPVCLGTGLHLASEGAWVGGGVNDLAIVKVLAAKAATVVIRSSQKQGRLCKEAAAVARQMLQKTRTLKNTNKKRSREKESIASYFSSSRNFDVTVTLEKINNLPNISVLVTSKKQTLSPLEVISNSHDCNLLVPLIALLGENILMKLCF